MELLQLKYFQTVARLEHMTKAAEELHIAQPALSKTISRLESDLGVPLFDRHKRQITLNAFGRIFLEQVEIALHAIEEGKRRVAEEAGLEKGRVAIATTNHNCDAKLVGSFLDLHPDINIRLTQPSTEDEKWKLLLNREIDFCITSLPFDHPDLENVSLLTVDVFLAVPAHHPFASRKSIYLKEAALEPFISMKKGTGYRVLTDGLCREAGFVPNISCEVDNSTVIASFVNSNMGIALLSEPAKKQKSSLVLIPIEQPVCQRTFQLSWMKNHYLSQAALTFRDYLIEYYKDEGYNIESP